MSVAVPAVAVATRLSAPADGVIVAVYRPSPRASSGKRASVQRRAHRDPVRGRRKRPRAPGSGAADPRSPRRRPKATRSRPAATLRSERRGRRSGGLPVLVVPASTATGSTVRSRSALSPAPVAPGNTAFASAAAPDTCGVAIDVPSSNRYVAAPPGRVDVRPRRGEVDAPRAVVREPGLAVELVARTDGERRSASRTTTGSSASASLFVKSLPAAATKSSPLASVCWIASSSAWENSSPPHELLRIGTPFARA